MATLPDLDTSAVSFVAYWNALNHGVSDINPDEAVSAPKVTSTEYYDNGVIAEYEYWDSAPYPTWGAGVVPAPLYVRIKEDGWFTAYYKVDPDYATDSGSITSGPWEILPDVYDYQDNPGGINSNTLAQAIGSLQSELSNSGSIAFTQSDVALYNYDYEAASAFTDLDTYTPSDTSHSARFAYTDGTTIHKLYAFAFTQNEYTADQDCSLEFLGDSTVTLAGPTIPYESIRWGVSDETGNVGSPSTSYGHDLLGDANSVTAHALIGWS